MRAPPRSMGHHNQTLLVCFWSCTKWKPSILSPPSQRAEDGAAIRSAPATMTEATSTVTTDGSTAPADETQPADKPHEPHPAHPFSIWHLLQSLLRICLLVTLLMALAALAFEMRTSGCKARTYYLPQEPDLAGCYWPQRCHRISRRGPLRSTTRLCRSGPFLTARLNERGLCHHRSEPLLDATTRLQPSGAVPGLIEKRARLA